MPEKGEFVFGPFFGQFKQVRVGFVVLASFQGLFVVVAHFLSVLPDALLLCDE